MKKCAVVFMMIGLLFVMTSTAFAAIDLPYDINVTVQSIGEISITTGALTMSISRAHAGQELISVVRQCYYDATINAAGKKITAAFDDDWITVDGMVFTIDPGDTVLGSATGSVVTFNNTATTDVAQDLCDASGAVGSYTEQLLVFTFSATCAAGVLASDSHVLTLTLI